MRLFVVCLTRFTSASIATRVFNMCTIYVGMRCGRYYFMILHIGNDEKIDVTNNDIVILLMGGENLIWLRVGVEN
jgi:hypothetical protein